MISSVALKRKYRNWGSTKRKGLHVLRQPEITRSKLILGEVPTFLLSGWSRADQSAMFPNVKQPTLCRFGQAQIFTQFTCYIFLSRDIIGIPLEYHWNIQEYPGPMGGTSGWGLGQWVPSVPPQLPTPSQRFQEGVPESPDWPAPATIRS